MTRFSFIRHARTSWNMEKRLQGSRDLPLCSEGEQDARAWARVLNAHAFDLVLSSPLMRARQTADIITGELGLDAAVETGLSEQDFGEWEGKRLKDLRQMDPDPVAEQETLGWHFCAPGGEPRTAVRDRGLAAMDRAGQVYQGKQLLVVTHNSMIKCLVYHWLARRFLPGEAEVIKPWHLHRIEWAGRPVSMELNRIGLNQLRA